MSQKDASTRNDMLCDQSRSKVLKYRNIKPQQIWVSAECSNEKGFGSRWQILHQVNTILGVTITNGLSISPHVQSVIALCAQVSYALRVLLAQGVCDNALHTIHISVVVAKLLYGIYASSAWKRFANATDRNKIQSFINKSKRNGYCLPDLPDFNRLICALQEGRPV